VIDYIRAEARPVDKYGHQPRLYALATQLGQGTAYDDDVLFAAVWLHDLGVFIGHRPEDAEELARWSHVPYTIERARQLLVQWGFPTEKIEAVALAIGTHQAEDEPANAEAILLRDADILEQLGAVGALRAIVKVGRDTRYPTFSSVLPILDRAVDQLPAKLRSERAKAQAVERIQFLQSLIRALENEAGPLLF
jgi:uncharacterized protein